MNFIREIARMVRTKDEREYIPGLLVWAVGRSFWFWFACLVAGFLIVAVR